jgi:hypothetical protein
MPQAVALAGSAVLQQRAGLFDRGRGQRAAGPQHQRILRFGHPRQVGRRQLLPLQRAVTGPAARRRVQVLHQGHHIALRPRAAARRRVEAARKLGAAVEDETVDAPHDLSDLSAEVPRARLLKLQGRKDRKRRESAEAAGLDANVEAAGERTSNPGFLATPLSWLSRSFRPEALRPRLSNGCAFVNGTRSSVLGQFIGGACVRL